MITVRKASERGSSRFDWLDSRHTFSFADYHDPAQMGFRALRVINEDRVTPGQGFGTHPHRDMEIVSWVLEGEIEHKDSLGNGSRIKPGEIQRMTAGTGVRHSEFNPSKAEPMHFLQIWILPEKNGLPPGYEQKRVEGTGPLTLIGSRNGRAGSITIHQDVDLWAVRLAEGGKGELSLRSGRGSWVQVTRGRLTVNGEKLEAGDGAALEGVPSVGLTASEPAEALLFDLA